MRIVAVNHLHPATRHIGGTRVPRFAAALAAQGHQVVLLTAPLDGEPSSHDPAALRQALSTHDWSRPLHLTCRPQGMPLLRAARGTVLPRPARRAILAAHYLIHGGVFTDWRQGSKPLWPVLARHFRPEVTWGTFGNTDAWAIARGIAHAAGCPWVMDIKDVWDAFIPAPVRGVVARRFDDAAACTGLSQGHLDRSGAVFTAPKTAVYSGIPVALTAAPPPVMPFRITLAGSTYGWLDPLIDGIGRFVERLPPDQRQDIVVTYAGAEHAAVNEAAKRLGGQCRTDVRPFVPLNTLFGLHREAFANLYGRRVGYPDWFHHKLFELLCADRPIGCYPLEYTEARDIAARAGGQLHPCETPEDLAAMLERAWAERTPDGVGADRAILAGYSWEAQAEVLAGVLAGARP